MDKTVDREFAETLKGCFLGSFGVIIMLVGLVILAILRRRPNADA